VLFTDSANQDLLNARDWYENQQGGLGIEFLDEVELAATRIEMNPEQFAISYRDVRICPVKRFPYIIAFRINIECTEILSVMHTRRDPDFWKQRG
jgi:toxin ParE1/3/4